MLFLGDPESIADQVFSVGAIYYDFSSTFTTLTTNTFIIYKSTKKYNKNFDKIMRLIFKKSYNFSDPNLILCFF